MNMSDDTKPSAKAEGETGRALPPQQPPKEEGEDDALNGDIELGMKTRKRDPQHSAEDEMEAAAPPALERSQARQISRIGATAVAGIDAGTEPAADFDLPTAGDTEPDPPAAAPPPPPSLVAYSSTGSSTVATHDAAAAEVTATLVSDDEYQADLQRAILRSSVRASKVEPIPEDESTCKKYQKSCWCAAICFLLLLIPALVAAIIYSGVANDMIGDSDDPPGKPNREGPPGGPPNEDVLGDFFSERSFDGGEALQEYASPQRIALRFIAAEFPNAPMDEKLVDVYAVATFFFSAGGISWNNNTKWKSGDPVCIWHGIECDARGHVIGIQLANNSLVGTFPPELGLLKPRSVGPKKGGDSYWTMGLQRLDISHNGLEGTIPESVGGLKSMEEFFVDDNGFWGSIPTGISQWDSLRRASFANNDEMRGEIPDHMCSDTVYIAVNCERFQCSCCSCAEEVSSDKKNSAT